MRPDRAILFDLDDTLYPLRRFVLSGFGAVAGFLELTRGLDRRAVFADLARTHRQEDRRQALQACAVRFGVPLTLVPTLIDVMRAHHPRLRLPATSQEVLARLRPEWRLAILTNGVPAIQARKVEALGLGRLVDAVVFANEHGSGRGKPEPAPFQVALARLDVTAENAVMVGDSAECDVLGARAAGIAAIRLARAGWVPRIEAGGDVMTIRSLADVPHFAHRLLSLRRRPHVA
jgi:putative hydrolase of the HAD superfamily